MPCLLIVVALLIPRVTMLFIWLFTKWFGQAFDSWLMPLLGFVFMPYTTLAYMAAMLHNHRAVSAGWLVVIIIAAVVDVGHWGSGKLARKKKTA